MKRLLCMMIAAAACTPAFASSLEELRPILGLWESPDGTSRTSNEMRMDGDWIETRMWFKIDGAWKLVGAGGIYRRPDDHRIVGVSRVREMLDIELFETVLTPDGDAVRVSNRATLPDKSVILSEETWTFPAPGRMDYAIYRIEDGARTPWFTGGWVKIEERP